MKTNIELLFIISRSILLRVKHFQTKIVDKIETDILCSVNFLIVPL